LVGLTSCASTGPLEVTSASQVSEELTKAGFIDCEVSVATGYIDSEYQEVSCKDSEDQFNRLYFYLFSNRSEVIEWWNAISPCPSPNERSYLNGDNWFFFLGGGSWGEGSGDIQPQIDLQQIFGGELNTPNEIACS
jgi:hypothetical protein